MLYAYKMKSHPRYALQIFSLSSLLYPSTWSADQDQNRSSFKKSTRKRIISQRWKWKKVYATILWAEGVSSSFEAFYGHICLTFSAKDHHKCLIKRGLAPNGPSYTFSEKYHPKKFHGIRQKYRYREESDYVWTSRQDLLGTPENYHRQEIPQQNSIHALDHHLG